MKLRAAVTIMVGIVLTAALVWTTEQLFWLSAGATVVVLVRESVVWVTTWTGGDAE